MYSWIASANSCDSKNAICTYLSEQQFESTRAIIKQLKNDFRQIIKFIFMSLHFPFSFTFFFFFVLFSFSFSWNDVCTSFTFDCSALFTLHLENNSRHRFSGFISMPKKGNKNPSKLAHTTTTYRWFYDLGYYTTSLQTNKLLWYGFWSFNVVYFTISC